MVGVAAAWRPTGAARAATRGRAPADEAVAWGSLPSGGAKAEQGERQAVTGADEVAHLGPGQVLVAEIVVAVDELVPQAGELRPPGGGGQEAMAFT